MSIQLTQEESDELWWFTKMYDILEEEHYGYFIDNLELIERRNEDESHCSKCK